MYTLMELVTRHLILNRHLINRKQLPKELVAHLDDHIDFHDTYTRPGHGSRLSYFAIKMEYCRRHVNQDYAHRPNWRIQHDLARWCRGEPTPDWIDQPIADVPVTIRGDGYKIRTFRDHPEALAYGFYINWLGFDIPIHFGGSGYQGACEPAASPPRGNLLAKSMP